MPQRLDRVSLDLWHGTFEFAWSSREELLEEIGNLPEAEAAVRSFTAVGAVAPVRLSNADKEFVANAIERWAVDVGELGLPPGVWELRCALVDDVAAFRK